jgi:hypothetical protein
MSQVYLPNNDFLNQWRALSLDEMKAQPAFQAVLDYYKTKGQIEPTFGQYLEPNGRVVVTMVFTDASDPSNSLWVEAADAICSPIQRSVNSGDTESRKRIRIPTIRSTGRLRLIQSSPRFLRSW